MSTDNDDDHGIRSNTEICPKCGSRELSGLVAAFWARLSPSGWYYYPFGDHESDTEIGPERLCRRCGHEFLQEG